MAVVQKKITSEKVVLTSFLVDISDVVINLGIAIISGSVVMVSQALEGMADLMASGFLLIGIKRSNIPRDKKHPYGHGRELYFWTFISALFTFTVTAGASFYIGLKRYLSPQPIEHLNWAIIALVLAIITNGYSMSLSYRRLFIKRPLSDLLKVFSSSALIETKTTLILDTMGTFASMLGLTALLVYNLSGDVRFDGLGAMAIGITLAALALVILKSAKDLLVGQSAPVEVEEKIKSITQKDPNVKKVIDLRTLQIGPRRMLVNMEIHLTDELTSKEIEPLVDKIEKEIKSEIPSATNIQIELETPDVVK